MNICVQIYIDWSKLFDSESLTHYTGFSHHEIVKYLQIKSILIIFHDTPTYFHSSKQLIAADTNYPPVCASKKQTIPSMEKVMIFFYNAVILLIFIIFSSSTNAINSRSVSSFHYRVEKKLMSANNDYDIAKTILSENSPVQETRNEE